MSSKIWYTSDTHWGHANIIKYTNRPFGSVDEMNRVLVDRWNEKVGKEDILYHCGDVTLGDRKKAMEFFGQVNGRIHVIGNHWHHDHRWITKEPGHMDITSASGHKIMIEQPIAVIKDQNMIVVLSHYPQSHWDRSHHGSIHLCGHRHLHENTKGEYHEYEKEDELYRPHNRIYDVGVDANDFFPVSLETIVTRLKENAKKNDLSMLRAMHGIIA